MANLLLRHVYKIYPGVGKAKRNAKGETKKRSGDFVAVKDFNMEIEDGEFIVFVGPSGCGKSTTLRMIAGLEEISGGELYIDGRLMNNVDAKDRDIAMVFQNYALYPHLTSYDNIAFGLRLRKKPVVRLDDNGNEIIAIDEHKIAEITKVLKKLNKEMDALLASIARCESAIGACQERMDALKAEKDALSMDAAENVRAIQTLAKQLEKVQAEKEQAEKDLAYYSEKKFLLAKTK